MNPPRPDSIEALEMTGSTASRQVEEMVAAWGRGERPRAEEYLARDPDLEGEEALRLIFEEFCLRQEAGLGADPREFAQRFPQWWPELELLLDCHRLMDSTLEPSDLPNSGEEVAGFRLLAELGRGVLGRVFLASELALAGRPTVIKVSPLGRDEHLSLARLQHMNIVPLYSARVLHDRRLQVLCMPFLGGASLAHVLTILKPQEAARRTGSDLITALNQIQARLPVTISPRGPFLQHILDSSYVEAICWVGICLADGLQYAHDRRFVHMDIKPSNVLLAGDGQPMLLDFHLAREPIAQGDPAPFQLGGTSGYMAPEHEAAMVAVSQGQPIREPLDGRADLYSLGMILYEALGGPGPSSAPGPRPPLHRCNPRVSVGLSSLIHKCLSPRAIDRYPDAASMASDLRRSIDGLPLRGVPNRSVVERWRNWRRRSPHALTRSLILLVSAFTATAALGLLWAAYLQRVHQIETALADGQTYRLRHQFVESSKALNQGRALARLVPGVDHQQHLLAESLRLTQRSGKAEELHRLAEYVRFRYGIDPPPPEAARALIERTQSLWNDREFLIHPAGKPDDSETQARVRADLLDVLLARVNLQVQLAPKDLEKTARNQAIETLGEAELLLGQSPEIDRERRILAGRSEPDDSPIDPRTAGDHFGLGKSYLRSRKFAEAGDQFQKGLELRPQDFWLNFYQGICAYKLGQFESAVNAFRVCVALSPETAECYYNQARALGALGRSEEASRDYTQALRCNPTLTAAWLNRAISRYEQGRLPEADNDLNQALRSATTREDRGIISYNQSLVAIARGDRPSARSYLKTAIDCGHEAARQLQAKLREP